VGQTDPTGQDQPSTEPLPVINDVEVLRKTSTETIISNPIVTVARATTVLPTADQAKAALLRVLKGGSIHTSLSGGPTKAAMLRRCHLRWNFLLTVGLRAHWIWYLWKSYSDTYLKCFTGCHRLRLMLLLLLHLWEVITLHLRGPAGCQSQRRIKRPSTSFALFILIQVLHC
jgi:hypothetical protein